LKIIEFCTEWPKELDKKEECDQYFPIEITTSNYIYDGPSLRDDRARVVKLKFKLSSLGLNQRATDKFIKLVGERYDKETDFVTIEADRCPYRNQNEDYAMYLLTTLYYESQVSSK
jgi:small subunit ribosomal protein S35